jgi:hypothetical protein
MSAYDPLRTFDVVHTVIETTTLRVIMTDEERARWGSPLRKRLYYLAIVLMLAVAAFTLVRSVM